MDRLYAFAPILGPSGAQVWLSIGRTPEVLYAAEAQALQRDLIGVGGILLLALAARWWGSNRLLLSRIDQLVRASTRLAGGDWESRAPVRAAGAQGDELDKLALAFNQMADTLLQRQTELATRERHLHLAMQAARMVAWTWDPVHDQITTTDNFAEVYGLSPIQYVAQGFALLHPDDKERHSGIVTRSAAEQIPYRSEFRIVRPDNGQTVWLDERAVPILDAAGNLQRFAGLVIDTTERKRVNEALRQASAQLEERVRERTAELERSNRELNQFAYVASHDLKAPLRAIDNLANWITEDAAPVLPPHSAEHLTKLRGRVRRMEKLLDDLLAYSRAGRVRPPVEMVDLNALVQDIVAVLAPPPGFTVTVEQPAPVLRTPRVSLELVLRNLIGNAIKHHHEPSGQIHVHASTQGDRVEFAVSDNGPGIEPQYHQRIFEMYQTLNPRDQTEGSGMGLALVKKLIESYGGAVTVESSPGQGATFRFTWPYRLDGTDEPG